MTTQPAATSLWGPEPIDDARQPGWLFTVAVWLALIALVGIYLFRIVWTGFNPDELEHVHSSWLILQGQRPYLDFFQHHNPLLWYYLAPIVHLWEGDATALIAARAAQLPLIAIYIVATYLLGRRLFGSEVGLLAALILLTNVAVFNSLIEVRPDVPQNAFGMLSVLLLFWDRQPARRWLPLLAGLSAGLAFVFLQKAIFLIFSLGLILTVRAFRNRHHLPALTMFTVGVAVPVMVFVMWLFWFNDPVEYYFTNWTLNRAFQNQFSPVRFGAFQYQANAIPWMFATLSLLTFRHAAAARELMVLLIFLLLSLFVVRSPYLQYWLPAVPLMAVFGAHGLRAVLVNDLRRLLAIGVAIAFPVVAYVVVSPTGTAAAGCARIQYVLEQTEPDDLVYDGRARFNLFRQDVDYFWYSLGPTGALKTWQKFRAYPYDIYELIERQQPKVISDYHIEDMNHPAIAGRYRRDDKHPFLWIRND